MKKLKLLFEKGMLKFSLVKVLFTILTVSAVLALVSSNVSPRWKGKVFKDQDGWYIKNHSKNKIIVFTIQFSNDKGSLSTKGYSLLPGEIEQIMDEGDVKYRKMDPKYKPKVTGAYKQKPLSFR